MMFVFATILFLVFLTIGVGLIVVSSVVYWFAWTANGKQTLESVLICGSIVAIGLFTIWIVGFGYWAYIS